MNLYYQVKMRVHFRELWSPMSSRNQHIQGELRTIFLLSYIYFHSSGSPCFWCDEWHVPFSNIKLYLGSNIDRYQQLRCIFFYLPCSSGHVWCCVYTIACLLQLLLNIVFSILFCQPIIRLRKVAYARPSSVPLDFNVSCLCQIL